MQIKSTKQTINNPKGAGAPTKYKNDLERKEARRLQVNNSNKLGKAKSRLKIKTLTKINSQKDYKNGLVNLFQKYNFNYFFTGTYHEDFIHKDIRVKKNKEITDTNKENNTNLKLIHSKKLSLKSLISYTTNFIEYLTNNKAINKSVSIYEKNKSNEWHCHIFLDVNKNIYDVENYLSKCWKIGISDTIHILDQEEKIKVLQYMVKDILINTGKKYHEDTVLNWNFTGITDDTIIDDSLTFEQKKDLENILKVNFITLEKVA